MTSKSTTSFVFFTIPLLFLLLIEVEVTRADIHSWSAVDRGKSITFNMETNPLEIKTTASSLGSSKQFHVIIKDQEDATVGSIIIFWGTDYRYEISDCNNFKPLPIQPPSGNNKIWRISKLTGPKLVVHCDNLEVLSKVINGGNCDLSGLNNWNNKAGKIEFADGDSASNFYRAHKAGWITVIRSMRMRFDLETTPLEINTFSTKGSNQQIYVTFNDDNSENTSVGFFKLLFSSSTLKFYISGCNNFKPFPTQPPSGNNKIWKISKLPGPKLLVHCNDVEVLDVVINSVNCDWSGLSTWNNKAKQIEYSGGGDTASEFYRAFKEECTGLKSTWSNMITDKQFPVTKGDVLTLSCRSGLILRGDQKVTCNKDTEFTFQVEPSCLQTGY